ncbi:hydroxyacid dehydrogenase [Ectothiorhodospiraceae bacterium 2226]|nr:hydroxyacid dehydrogenase [Ectothiorhodospiraceae bacterium 2226]
MKLLYADACSEERPWVREALPELEIAFTEDCVDSGALPEGAEDAEVLSVFVSSRVDRALLERMPKLAFVAARSTGVDHIDLRACRERGIQVANVPTYGERTVAEHAFALMLDLSRKVCQARARTTRLDFDRTGLRGFDLFRKTLGVVGTGGIGRNTIRIAKGFGMEVIAYDVRPLADADAHGFRYVDSLDTLLSQSDVVSLHVPYVPATHHLINRDNLQRIKRGALLINTARGAVVDTEALLWALDEGLLGGAGLDVLEEELATFTAPAWLPHGMPAGIDAATLLRNQVLAARPDVVLTPHNAYNSAEAFHSIVETSTQNVAAFLGGRALNLVTA